MKVSITAKGIMKIEVESELESYALKHWYDKNKDEQVGTIILFCLEDEENSKK